MPKEMTYIHMSKLYPERVGASEESYPLFRCPKCKCIGIVDWEQFRGVVSIECYNNCGYHETIDWLNVIHVEVE